MSAFLLVLLYGGVAIVVGVVAAFTSGILAVTIHKNPSDWRRDRPRYVVPGILGTILAVLGIAAVVIGGGGAIIGGAIGLE